MKWELRPVKSPDGTIHVREVYYNHKGLVCHVEMDIRNTYHRDEKKCIESLIESYPDVKMYNRYNPEILSHDPSNESMSEWTFSDE